jgi:hypothetical protein
VLLQLCAKNVLREFAKENAGPLGFAELMAGRMLASLKQKNPVTARMTDSESLRASEYSRTHAQPTRAHRD